MAKTPTKWEVLLEELGREFQLRELELSLLHDIDRHLLSHQRPDESLFRDIVRRTGELLGSPRTRIQLKRGRFLENTYSTVESEVGERILVADSVTWRCVTQNVTVNIADLGPDTPFRRSLIAAPIRLGDEPIGVLSGQSPEPNAFTEIHETIITAVAAQVAIALQREQSFDLAAVSADVDALVFSDDQDSKTVIQSALNRIMEELGRQRLQFSGAQILFKKSSEELEIVYSTNPSDIGLKMMIEDSICGRAIREKQSIVVGDVSREREYHRMLGPAIRSEIAVPILIGAGTLPIAVLNVESEELDVFGGFNKLAVDSFAVRVSTLLAFAKLRSDVTESLELRSTNDLLAAVGDQASNMIHRLNNTVGAMRFQLKELLAAYDEGTLAIDKDLGKSIQSLLGLADRTLDMPHRVTLLLNQESPVEINQCVRHGIDEIGIPLATELRLALSDDVEMQAPANFDIVVQNLIQNALDAMPGGGVLSISTCIESHEAGWGGHVLLTVKDSGYGISPEVLPRIFDLKFTTKTETRKGLGLGLWWVRNLVRKAGGEVIVRSEPGEGSQFVVKLPIRKEVNGVDSRESPYRRG